MSRLSRVFGTVGAMMMVGGACNQQAEPAAALPGNTPAPTTPREEKLVPLVFREDGPPAVPNPRQEDRDWKPAGYDPLVASRRDGKPTFSNSWFDGNIPNWKRFLGPLAGKPGLRYLEVGVFEGRSFLWVFSNILTHPTSTAVGIDLFDTEGLEERFRENLQRAGVSDRTEVLVGYSNEKLRGLQANSFDIIYIDGSHLAHNVLRDAVLSWDLLKVDGLLIMDDYGYRRHAPLELRPAVAIEALITSFQKEMRVLHLGWQAILQKIEDPCPGLCTRIGMYEFYWADNPSDSVLFDPRTKARVPLDPSESSLLQRVLAGRKFGVPGVFANPAVLKSPEFNELRRKLGL